MPVVPICFADSVKKEIVFFLVYICSWAKEIPAISAGFNICSLYIYIFFLLINFPFVRRRSKQNSRCQRSQTVETQFHQRTVRVFCRHCTKKRVTLKAESDIFFSL